MANLFATSAMAAGYARFRPPLHALILERVRPHLPFQGKASRGLDVGCGAGLSTKPLQSIAEQTLGIDPGEPMVRVALLACPGSLFAVAYAEEMPVGAASVDVMTAAGSLNYVNLPRFFDEAARILTAAGTLVAYDFSPGNAFRDSGALKSWFARFIERYPWPPGGAALDPERLARIHPGFETRSHEHFEIALTLTPTSYLEYMLTETNVSFAAENGESAAAIRSWCESTLRPVWGAAAREVLFRGYFACLARRSPG